MERDNILPFPCPGDDPLSGEFDSRLAELTEQLEIALSGGGDGYAQQLARIEEASIVLKNISLLVSRGRDRMRAIETFQRVMLSIKELRSKLRNEA